MFLKVELTNEIVEQGYELGLVKEDVRFDNEEQANKEGFFWFDEIECWVNIEGMNEEFEETVK